MSREKIICGWSGGKDSALALHAVQRSSEYEVSALVTTCTEGFRRISMHGVRCSLLKNQAVALGLPLRKVFVPSECSNADYERQMHASLAAFKRDGISKIIFGDIFLEEIRRYRDALLAGIGMTALYPLWGCETATLAAQFIRAGFRAVLVCVDSRALSPSFAGREFSAALLAALPKSVDACGENGEFHTFVFDGPLFRKPVRFRAGATVTRNNFHFADLLPVTSH